MAHRNFFLVVVTSPLDKQSVVGVPGSVSEPTAGTTFALRSQPNPFTDTGTRLVYSVPAAGRVTLSVYGVDGRRLLRLVDQEVPAGPHTATWEGRDAQGNPLPNGVYYATIEYRGETRVHRMVKAR